MNDNVNPAAWFGQANAMFKAWADQQQAALRAWTAQASAAAATPNASVPPPSLESMFGAAQAMWADSLQRWTSVAQQALPAGSFDAMLKAMFDPSRWPDLASSPLDRAIEHLVDGPSYATLWTLDRKLLKAQKLRLEWSRDLAAYQLVLHSAWSEALQRFFAEINARRRADHDLARAHRCVDRRRERDAGRSASQAGVPGSAAPPDALVHRMPAAGARDRGRLVRDAPHSRRAPRSTISRAPSTSCDASSARCPATRMPASAPQASRAATRESARAARASPHAQAPGNPMTGRLQLDPSRSAQELAELSQRMLRGGEALRSIRDEDVQIATTPKREVYRQDKTVLYHYTPMTDRRIERPVLVVYGLVGRYTMTDLQEDRSLIRNLLQQGVDLYAVDWGNPTRADRWLTLDDYIDRYLADCIEHICRAHDVDSINLLGVCEGGVFTLCYAALHPERVNNLIVTITPVDFHADQAEGRKEHGFINLWTRSLSGRGRRSADRGERQPARRADELRVLDDDAAREPHEIQPGPARRRRRSQQAAQLPAHGEMAGRSAASPGRSREAMAEGSLPGEPAGAEPLRDLGAEGRARARSRCRC